MLKKKIILTLLLNFLNFDLVLANINFEIKDISFFTNGTGRNEKNNGYIKITFDKKDLKKIPYEISTNNKMLQIVLKEAKIWPKIEKKVSLNSKNYSANLFGYQYEKNVVRIRLFEDHPDFFLNDINVKDVKTEIGENTLVVVFPMSNMSNMGKGYKVKEIKNVRAEDLNESFLNDISREDERNNLLKLKNKNEINNQNKINKSSKTNFINEYVAKFLVAIGSVILLFLGILALFKKSVFLRNKINFLKGHQFVNILSRTSVGPSKNLLLVRMHQQVILLSDDSKGVHYLCEVNDPISLLKKTEFAMTGDNFDHFLDKNVKDSSYERKDSFENIELSNQLKKKMNKIRQHQ